MRRLTASDRSALIKLASSLPAGSPERKAILAGLQGSPYANQIKDLESKITALEANKKVPDFIKSREIEDLKWKLYQLQRRSADVIENRRQKQESNALQAERNKAEKAFADRLKDPNEKIKYLKGMLKRMQSLYDISEEDYPHDEIDSIRQDIADLEQQLKMTRKASDVLSRLEAATRTRLKPGRNNILGYPVDLPDQQGGDLLYFHPIDADAAKGLIDELRALRFKVRFDKSDKSIVLT